VLTDDRLHKKKVRVRIYGDTSLLSSAGGKDLGKKLLESLETGGIHQRLQRRDAEPRNSIRRKTGDNTCSKHGSSRRPPCNRGKHKKNLWIKSEPEIIIRTAEHRLSNFLVWQSAYSEIYFVEKLWQEFEKPDLKKYYQTTGPRRRRFGK